ncbi:MAG: hypothetical protein ACREDY_15310 [Bradyrhizobium sp.]
MLKHITIGIAVLGALATPALAQQYVPSAGSGNLVQGPGGPPVKPNTPAYVGQKNGEAYNYGRSTTGQGVRHTKRHKTQQHQDNQ